MQPSNIRSHLSIGIIWAFLAQMLTVLFGIASAALLARLISSSELGVFFLASSFIILFSSVFQLGLGKSATRMIPVAITEGKLTEAWALARTMFSLALISVVLGVLALNIFGFDYLALNVLNSSTLISLKWLILSWGALYSLRTILLDIYRGFHDIRSAVLFGEPFTKLIFTIALAIVWIMGFDISVATALIIVSVSVMASMILSIIVLIIRGRSYFQFSLTPVKPILIISLPLMVVTLGNMAYAQASILMVGAFGSEQEVALYGAAMRLVILVPAPLLVITSVIPPIIANLYASNSMHRLEKLLQISATIAIVPTTIFMILFVFFGKEILNLVYGEYYEQAYTLLVILGVGQFLSVLTGASGIALAMTSHQNSIMRITGVGVVLLLSVGILAGSKYGAIGVAIANSCVIGIVMVVTVFTCKTKIGVRGYASISCLKISELAVTRDLLLERFRKKQK